MTESPDDAFNRHDLDSIVELYEPDAVLARFDGPVAGNRCHLTVAVRKGAKMAPRWPRYQY